MLALNNPKNATATIEPILTLHYATTSIAQQARRLRHDYIAFQKWLHAGKQTRKLRRRAYSCASVVSMAHKVRPRALVVCLVRFDRGFDPAMPMPPATVFNDLRC